ncbi:MAG TPA: hypothetical protein VFY28_01725 [Candidatus Paceibacterota bacterium]|nr:hypothetical protein [Candidatus Paceibacterota bacterium]
MNANAPRPRGQIILVALVFFAIFLTIATALISYVVQYRISERHAVASAKALYLAEAGIDLAAYRLNATGGYTGETDTSLGAGVVDISVENISSNTKLVTATAHVPDRTNPIVTRTIKTKFALNTSIVAFHFGVQVGNEGISMNNNAGIIGNIYSNGNITGSGGAYVTGDATTAGTLSAVHVGGTAWANTLSDCQIDGDASYQTISSCTVGGTSEVSTSDPALAAMPISDEQIDEWEDIAAAGGLITGNYAISGTELLGPISIDGDLTVNGTLSLTGPVWVKGDVIFANNSALTVDSSVGDGGAILMADYPGNESSKGQVTLSNNMTISGNGNAGSYPMVLSTNTSGNAINLSNNAAGVILYAPHGTVSVNNNAGANQITAKRLHLNNNATIEYVNGLQSQSFSNGPGGSWGFVPGTYGIIR